MTPQMILAVLSTAVVRHIRTVTADYDPQKDFRVRASKTDKVLSEEFGGTRDGMLTHPFAKDRTC
jgi:hypothetical protein